MGDVVSYWNLPPGDAPIRRYPNILSSAILVIYRSTRPCSYCCFDGVVAAVEVEPPRAAVAAAAARSAEDSTLPLRLASTLDAAVASLHDLPMPIPRLMLLFLFQTFSARGGTVYDCNHQPAATANESIDRQPESFFCLLELNIRSSLMVCCVCTVQYRSTSLPVQYTALYCSGVLASSWCLSFSFPVQVGWVGHERKLFPVRCAGWDTNGK